MKSVLGIDIGGSTTKIIGYRDGGIFSPILVKANDPRASLYGAFGKFMSVNCLSLTDIEKHDNRCRLGGGGKRNIRHQNPRISEFQAIGRGGLFLSGLDSAVIVSMGTVRPCFRNGRRTVIWAVRSRRRHIARAVKQNT